MLVLSLTVAMAHTVALTSPGSDFFFVSQIAVSRSRKEVMMGVLGITCDVMVQAGIVLLDLHLIIGKMTWLHILIMAGDGLRLCWMDYQMLRGALKKEVASAPASQVELAKSGRSFFKGLLINFANPKAIIYFGSVLSLSIGDNVGITERWGIFALIIAETPAWFIVVAGLFALSQMRRGYQRLVKWIDGSAGALFVGLGIHLVISRQCQMHHQSKSDKAFTPYPTLFLRMPRRC